VTARSANLARAIKRPVVEYRMFLSVQINFLFIRKVSNLLVKAQGRSRETVTVSFDFEPLIDCDRKLGGFESIKLSVLGTKKLICTSNISQIYYLTV